MVTIDSLQFDHGQWQAIERKDHIQVFGDDVKHLTAVLSVEMFIGVPEIPVSLADIDKLRFVYRTIANNSGAGLISADVFNVDGIDCVQTIFKMPQANRGMVYIGSLTVPFAEFSFVIKIQCQEVGFTGLREAVVLDRLFDEGTDVSEENGELKNWERDPYDPEGAYPLMPNRAEDERYDEDFPVHALSRVRRWLFQIRETLHFSEEVKQAQPFVPGGC